MSKLKRTLTLPDAISIVAGSMIGSGIFIVSSEIARGLNSGLLLILVWLLAGYTTLCGSLCYGELACAIKDEGGQYIYLKKIFSERLAFVYGWTLFLVIQTGTLAAINIAFAKFMGLIFPYISQNNVIFSFFGYQLTTQQIFGLLTVLILTFINSRGVKSGMIVQNVFTVTKVLSLVGIIVCGLFFGFKFDVLSANLATFPTDFTFNFSVLTLLAVSIVGALFTSITWNNVTFVTSEIKKPRRNIPRALIIGTLLVIGLYFLINLIYLSVLPLELIKNAPQDIVAAGLFKYIFGSKGMIAIALIIAISAFGCANGMILTGSRVYYKMAKDRLFFRRLGYIDRKTHVPVNSLWLQAIWVCLLILRGNYFQLLDFVIFASLLFYAITIFGIFKMRKMGLTSKKIFKVPNFIPVSFLVISIFVLICLAVYKPTTTLPGLLITLVGYLAYGFWKRPLK